MLWILVLFALAASASETTTGTSSNSSQSTTSTSTANTTTLSTACVNASNGSTWEVSQLALLAASGWTLSGLLLIFTCCLCCFWLVRKVCSCCGNSSESESKATHAYTNAAFTSSDATLPMGTTGSYTPPQDGSFPPPPR
ncbi:membrane glycoprotein UL139 [Human betaherpesvirus 5]|uniref:Membrane glycoprotein UL139 n=1 Tax=Human cytomegalovirus TaxID=10359 RepID=D2W9T5_HCMV|nr:membrane glycoprotein UL139 [Human betaherpesvirus 5]WNA12819.1 membrane glycoprotein UL139 [Cytomegalovirus humanbeta5]AKI14029.1 membrane glycoprotein UL139 [Human betaherpesvirus 5]AKI14363.1 membrane glycoprotein UL139 [Human betaherpesvirus 5]AMO64804.1 membrane glycoprotein UL139 [Human betaherpesvirus 5]